METSISFGIPYLDDLTGGILLGDNIVWVVEPGTYYESFLECFFTAPVESPSRNVYVSFNFPPQKIFNRYKEFFLSEDFILVDAFTFGKGKGDEFFQSFYRTKSNSSEAFRIRCIENMGRPAEFIRTMSELQGESDETLVCRYIFDSLTGMQELWGEKETLRFFTYTCPKLYELKALAYWPLAREAHSRAFLANVGHITQLVISLSFEKDNTCAAKFLKVEGRSSHLLNGIHAYDFTNNKITFLDEFHGLIEKGRAADLRAWYEQQNDQEPHLGPPRSRQALKIGGRIREFRLEKKLSQVELARRLSITPSALSQIENNQSLPSLPLFVEIARLLGKSLDSFLANKGAGRKRN